MDDLISRKAAIDAIGEKPFALTGGEYEQGLQNQWERDVDKIKILQPARPEPMSDAYMKAVWTWLLDYQIKMAELKGRYTPYEVLSWVANDWRKEHERSD